MQQSDRNSVAVRHGQALRTPLTVSLLLCLLLFPPSSTALGTRPTQSESGPMIFDDAGIPAILLLTTVPLTFHDSRYGACSRPITPEARAGHGGYGNA
jgi:hypothetical protein